MKEDTRTNIMVEAIKLFAKKGFSDTSISQIAKSAEVGKGTIYWHFDSKEDLFLSIIKENGKEYFEKVKLLDKSEDKPSEIIFQYIKDRIKFVEDNYDLARMIINNNDVINKEFKKLMEEKHRQIVNVLERAIKKGMRNGNFKNGNSEELALMIINTANSAHQNFACSLKGDSNIKAKKIYDFIMHGLSGGKEDV
jgi:AcrR family transcriptional regulator